jgi:hypothetical protein
VSETAQQAASSRQGYRIELAPTPEQCVRLAQHAGLARVAENFYLEKIRAALAQRAAEQTYGVAEAELTRVPWTAPQLEALWRAAHPDRYPWFRAEGLSSRVPKEAARCRANALKNWVASRAGTRKGPKVGFPTDPGGQSGRHAADVRDLRPIWMKDASCGRLSPRRPRDGACGVHAAAAVAADPGDDRAGGPGGVGQG